MDIFIEGGIWMKKFLSALLVIAILFVLMPAETFAAGVTATKTASKVTVDGVVKSFDAYTINGNNYFKLRDIAYILSGTDKQFDVTWDGSKNAINLVSGKKYTTVGGEMTTSSGSAIRSATLSTSNIYLGGADIKLTAYAIGGNNYFKLRDLGGVINFEVEWDSVSNTIAIKSTTGYLDSASNYSDDEELARATSYGFVPKSWQSDLSKPVTYAQYCELVKIMLTEYDKKLLPAWEKRVAKALTCNSTLIRAEGSVILYFAMEAMGVAKLDNIDWQMGNIWEAVADVSKEWNSIDYSNSPFTFPNGAIIHYDEKVELQGGSQPIINAAIITSLTKRSHISYISCYDYKKPMSQPLTRADAILSVSRLYETDTTRALDFLTKTQTAIQYSTQEPSEAILLREAILNSETTIKKDTTFIKGQTYTGTAYYVSNSGSGINDGTSPERAIATLAKLNEIGLQAGDAVFFERGGLFRGYINAYAPGVTYSAYGTGAKPIITTAIDASGENQWKLAYENKSGAMIWVYNKKIHDCGSIVLDNGKLKPYRVLPDWSGTCFVNHRDQSPFNVSSDLTQDLDFFSGASSQYPNTTNFSVTEYPDSEGYLYFRCDTGNPGKIFATIELCAAYTDDHRYRSDIINLVDDVVLDNLNIKNIGGTGISYGSSGWVVQNCEFSGHGGTILSYNNGRPLIRGEAFCGSKAKNVTVANNWIHDNFVGINLEEYNNTKQIAVDGFNITSNLFEHNDTDLNFQNNNYSEGTFGVLRSIIVEKNVFLYTGGGASSLHVIPKVSNNRFYPAKQTRTHACVSNVKETKD